MTLRFLTFKNRRKELSLTEAGKPVGGIVGGYTPIAQFVHITFEIPSGDIK